MSEPRTAGQDAAPARAGDVAQDVQLTVIVVSYNTREITLACLRSLLEQTRDVRYEVIVLDNDSSDGSADAIAEEFPDLDLVRSPENLGFAEGNNEAAKRATGRYLLLLNPDTVVLDGAVQKLFAFAARRPEAGIWGGRTLFGDRSLNPTSCWGRMTPWSLFCRLVGLSAALPGSSLLNPEGYGGWQRDAVREVDVVTGCLLLITREMWERLGGFDRAFFMYGEEYDLCLRARELGARPAITPDATIVHLGGASEPVRSDKVVRLMAAKMHLVRRHSKGVGRGCSVALLASWPLLRAWAWRLIALLRRDEVSRKQAHSWGEVWRRRGEWIAGYEGREETDGC